MLMLGDRAPDEDALVFAYIYGLKEDILIKVLLKDLT